MRAGAGATKQATSADALARFGLVVALGSLLVAALDLPPVDHHDWASLIARLVDSI